MEEPLAIGIDMGGTTIKTAVVQGNRVLFKAPPIDTRAYASAQEAFVEIGALVAELRRSYPAIQAVGMGIPGFVNPLAGMTHILTNVEGWNNLPIRDMLEEATGLPAAIDNDANCMAYAEWKQGAGRGMDNLVCLTLGTGVGGGIIVDGHMLRGFMGIAGELGQMSIDYRGRRGYYNNAGALEDYIGHNEFTADAVARYAEAGITKTAAECNPLALELAAKAGDAVALACYDDFARKLATCLVTCHYLLNPEAFVIGGGLSKAGDLLFAPLRRYMGEQINERYFSRIKLLPAAFGNEAGLIGAAQQGLNVML